MEKNAKVPVLVAKRPLMCEEPYTKRDAYAAVSVTTAIMLALFVLGFILQKGSALHPLSAKTIVIHNYHVDA